MPATHSSRTLYRIDECPDLMADGCVGDEHGNFGLPVHLGARHRRPGVSGSPDPRARCAGAGPVPRHHRPGASIPVFVGNVEPGKAHHPRLPSHAIRLLTSVWLFDRRAVKPDKANASALALLPYESAQPVDRLWSLVRDTCPLPLLDHWRDIVLDLLQARSMLTRLPFALGPLEGHRLAIDVSALTQALGGLIQQRAHHGALRVPDHLRPAARSGGLKSRHRTCSRAYPLPSIDMPRRFPWHSCSRGSPAIS